MKTTTTKSENWTSETITFKSSKTSIEMLGYKFSIEKDVEESSDELGFECWDIIESGSVAFSVSKWDDDKEYMAIYGDIVRDAPTVAEAAAKMITNIY